MSTPGPGWAGSHLGTLPISKLLTRRMSGDRIAVHQTCTCTCLLQQSLLRCCQLHVWATRCPHHSSCLLSTSMPRRGGPTHEEVQTFAANLASCSKPGAQSCPVQVVQQKTLAVRQCWGKPQSKKCDLPARVNKP